MTDQAPTTDQPRLGWPWCGDVPSGGEHRGDAEAAEHDDGTITLAWSPDGANCTVVGRAVLDAIVEERNRLVRENERLRTVQRVELATVEPGKTYVLRVPQEITRAALADLRTQIDARKPAGTQFMVLAGVDFVGQAEQQLAAENERLRSLLTEALDGWAEMDAMVTMHKGGEDNPRPAEIRREAGLP